MRNNINIIIFTRSFPYGEYSEVFLKNELEIAVKHANITIYPLRDDKMRREIPGQVIVNNACSENSFLLYVSTIILMLKSKYFWNAVVSKTLINIKGLKSILFYFRTLFAAFLIRNIIRKGKVLYNEETVFYSYWYSYASLGLALLKHEGYLQNKIIARAHSYEIQEKEFSSFFPLRLLTYQMTDKIFTISKIGLQIINERYPGFEKKLNIAKLGVMPIKNHPNLLEESLVRVVSCSGVRPEKRVKKIFESLNMFAKENKYFIIEWTHIGAGSGYNDLINYTKHHEKNMRVKLVGFMDNPEVLSYYKHNDFNIFINLSELEGVPVTIMEAISASIPVIATNVGAISEIVTQQTGFLLNKEFTQTSFNDGIKYIITNYEMLSKSTFQFYLENYNAEINYNQFYNEISEL